MNTGMIEVYDITSLISNLMEMDVSKKDKRDSLWNKLRY